MKTNYNLIILLVLATTFSFAQTTLYFDFGHPFSTNLTPGNYNNVEQDLYTFTVGDHSIADMIDENGSNTGFSFEITSDFQYVNENGTTAPTGAAAIFPLEATKDSFFTQVGGAAYGEIKFGGLDDTKSYSFEIFSCRATDQNREAKFSVIGATTEYGYLNAGGPVATIGNQSNTVIISNVQPSGGFISIGLEKGPNNVSNYSYMNCLKMIETAPATSTDVMFDFGSAHADWVTPGNYNNFTQNDAIGATLALNDNTGVATGFMCQVTDTFIDRNAAGANPASGDAAIFDVKATKDSLFGSSNHSGVDDQTAAYEITGLDNAKFYSFEVFACRNGVSGNRTAKYEFVGSSTKSAVLNASSNLSNTVMVSNVQPTAGKITFNITPDATNDHASKYFYLGAMKMTETSVAGIQQELLANNGVKAYPNPVNDILNIDYILNETGKVNLTITDITGRIIHSENTGTNQAGTYSLKWDRKNTSAGVYFLNLRAGNSNVSKKIVLK